MEGTEKGAEAGKENSAGNGEKEEEKNKKDVEEEQMAEEILDTTDTGKYDEMVEKGKKFFERGDFYSALKCFRSAL